MTDSATPSAPLTPPARQGNTGFAVNISLLILRLFLGWVFIYKGCQHAFGSFGGSGIEAFAQRVHAAGFPEFLTPNQWAGVGSGMEIICGSLLILGLLTRAATLPIIITMLIAIVKFYAPHGFDVFQGGCEYHIGIIAISSVLLITGPGLLSADAYLFRRNLYAHGPQPLENPTPRN